MLVNTAGQLLQVHAFDHFPDEQIARLNGCMQALVSTSNTSKQQELELELLGYCKQANLYTEMTSSASLQQWYTIMSGYGMATDAMLFTEEVI